jgi:hypothetical protein
MSVSPPGSPTPTPTTPTATTVPFPELLAAGAGRVHTYESWARAVIAEALKRASASEEINSAGVSVPADITIRPESRDPSVNFPFGGSGTCGGAEVFGIRIHVDLTET